MRIKVQLWYPRDEQNINEVEIQLIDIRWPDSIRIMYDFDRDGWRILQASEYNWDKLEYIWKEVAFIPACDKWENLEESGS